MTSLLVGGGCPEISVIQNKYWWYFVDFLKSTDFLQSFSYLVHKLLKWKLLISSLMYGTSWCKCHCMHIWPSYWYWSFASNTQDKEWVTWGQFWIFFPFTSFPDKCYQFPKLLRLLLSQNLFDRILIPCLQVQWLGHWYQSSFVHDMSY